MSSLSDSRTILVPSTVSSPSGPDRWLNTFPEPSLATATTSLSIVSTTLDSPSLGGGPSRSASTGSLTVVSNGLSSPLLVALPVSS